MLVAAFLAALALVAGAAPASAHATLISSNPTEGEVLETAPDVVTFTFDEAVNLTANAVQVFDAAGDRIEAEATSRDTVIRADLPADLADGSYVVTWRAVSADAHPISGSLTFSIGAPSETVVAPKIQEVSSGARSDLSIAQGMQYGGLLLAGGLVIFTCWLVGAAGLPDRARRRVRAVLAISSGVSVFFAALSVPLAGVYQQGLGMGELFSRSAFDLDLVGDNVTVLGLQAVGLTVAFVATRAARLRGVTRLFATAGAAVALLSPAVVGHTRAFDPVSLLIVTDILHLSAGAIWFGGLVGLALTLPALATRERDAAVLIARFSTLAGGVLALLVASGALMSWRILGSWGALVDTTYGRLLLIKIAIVLVVLALAAYNRFRLLPRVQAAAGHDERVRSAHGVRRAVLAESGLLVVVLCVTGFLVNQSPREEPPTAAAVPSQVVVGTLEEFKVLATVTPGNRGRNQLALQLQDLTGEPLDGFAAPEVSLRSEQVDLGLVPVVPTAAGTYAAEVVFPSPGTWEVQVSLRESEFANPVTTLTVEIR